MICCRFCCTINKHSHTCSATMSESNKKKEERKTPLKCRFHSICIFGEPDVGKEGEFVAAAKELGKVVAARKIHFVYGGGIQGLRGSAALSACRKGSQILSVRIKELDRHIFTVGYDLQVSSIPERMGYMFYNAEAFIALPGGLETLDGISSIAYWTKLNFHQKPLGLLNVNGFYDGLLSFLDHAVEKGFLPQATRHTIVSASTADRLMDKLQSYAPKPDLLVKQIAGQSSNSSQKQKPDTTLRL